MNKKQLLGGIGVGMAVGAALSMAMTPKPLISRRSTTGKAIKAVSKVMDNVVDAMGI